MNSGRTNESKTLTYLLQPITTPLPLKRNTQRIDLVFLMVSFHLSI